MLGTILANRYHLIEQLGQGGMAAVFKAIDQTLERAVAVKVMNPSFFTDQELVDRFIREAKATAKLEHPHIMQVYDVGFLDGTYYMVMELLEGGTLKNWIQQHGVLPLLDALEIIKQVLYGLANAHQRGIIHRDLKPQNILRSQSGVWKLGDFGIAKVLSETTGLTKTGNVMGTVRYFSPEQARGAKAQFSSDLYSIGIILYEMITGAVPFDGEESVAIAIQHLQAPVPDPRIKRSDLPDQLVHVLYKALEKQPERRYQSANEMIQDIDQVIQILQNSNPFFPNPMPTNPTFPNHQLMKATFPPPTQNQKTSKNGFWKKAGMMALIILSVVGVINILSPDISESEGVPFEVKGFFSEKNNYNSGGMNWVRSSVDSTLNDSFKEKKKSYIHTELYHNYLGIEKPVKRETYVISYSNPEHFYIMDQARSYEEQKHLSRVENDCFQVNDRNKQWVSIDCIKMISENQERIRVKPI